MPDLLEGDGSRAAREGAPATARHPQQAGRRARAAPRRRAAARRAGHAQARPRRGGRLPQPARARPAGDGGRRAPRRRRSLLAAERLEPPGPYEAVATEPDLEQATWLAFLLALAGPGDPERQDAVVAAGPRFEDGEPPEPLAGQARAIAAYRQWAERAGSQAAGFRGESDWSPQRRFARVFERLALPGLGRGPRFELLATLGAAGLYELEAATLQLSAGNDATTQAAKRALQSGDMMLLERRARDLAAACELPLAALDRGLALWDDPAADVPDEEPTAALRSALALP